MPEVELAACDAQPAPRKLAPPSPAVCSAVALAVLMLIVWVTGTRRLPAPAQACQEASSRPAAGIYVQQVGEGPACITLEENGEWRMVYTPWQHIEAYVTPNCSYFLWNNPAVAACLAGRTLTMAGDSHMRNLYHDLRVAIGAVGSSTAANNGSAHAHGENFIAHASSTGTTLQFLWAASTASSYEEMAARAGVQTYLPWQRYIAEYLHNVTRAQVLATSSAKPQGLGDLLVLDYPQWEVLFGAQEFDVATDFAGWEVAAREFRRASPPPKAVVEFSHLQLPPALEASWRKAVARSGAVALRLEAPFRRGTGRQVGHGDQEAKTPDRGWHWGEGPFALMLRGLIMTHVSPSLCPCLARQLGVVVR